MLTSADSNGGFRPAEIFQEKQIWVGLYQCMGIKISLAD